MTLDRDDADQRLARLEKLMREARAKPAPQAENAAPPDEKRSRKAAQAKPTALHQAARTAAVQNADRPARMSEPVIAAAR